MEKELLFDTLWKDYVAQAPSASKIYNLLTNYGEKVKNDHVALRTVNLPEVGIEKLAVLFKQAGYIEKDSYHFSEKKLNAKHFEHESDVTAPKVFISELILEEFSVELKETVASFINKIPRGILAFDALLVSGRTWGTVSYQTYESLRKESEYAAWLYVYGFCANHFTINVNELESIENMREMNMFLKRNEFRINASGGEIKGDPEMMLEQSSILADKKEIAFIEGNYLIPSCYYEFAKRYKQTDGKLFQGFIAKSADKIFESTDLSLQH